MSIPFRTAQQHDLCGQLMGKLDPTKRVYIRNDFGSDIAKSASVAAATGANRYNSWDTGFVRSGEGAMTAAAHSGGGVKIACESSDSASGVLIKPRINNRWTDFKWDTSKEPAFECLFATGANVTTAKFQAGLALTGAIDSGTDADQLKLFYHPAGGAAAVTFKIAMSGGGTDITPIDTGVTAVANTVYNFAFVINADLYANWALTNSAGTAMASGRLATKVSSATDLKPLFGLSSDGASADPSMYLFHVTCSMNAYVS